MNPLLGITLIVLLVAFAGVMAFLTYAIVRVGAASDLLLPERRDDPIWHGTQDHDVFWRYIDGPARPENTQEFWRTQQAHYANGLSFGEAFTLALEEFEGAPAAGDTPRAVAGARPTLRSDDPYHFGEWPTIKPGFDS